MKPLLARLYFWLARVLLSRGHLAGQWFQNKGILVLIKIGVRKRD